MGLLCKLKHSCFCWGVLWKERSCIPSFQGIQASISLQNYSCWSYGPSHFLAVDGGINRACRGTRAEDDSPAYFMPQPD